MRRVYELIGITALLIGCLAPIAKQGDTFTFYIMARLGGSYVFILIIIAIILMALNKDELLWLVGVIMLGMMINDFRILYHLLGIKGENLFDSGNVKLSWGWVPLFTGALMLILTFFLGEDIERVAALGGNIRAFIHSLSPDAPFEGDDSEASEESGEEDSTQNVETKPPEDAVV